MFCLDKISHLEALEFKLEKISNPNRFIRKLEALELRLNNLENEPEQFVQLLQQHYSAGQLLILPLRWSGHTFCTTILKNLFALTNRGEGGDPEFGTLIYRIRPNTDVEKFIFEGFNFKNLYTSEVTQEQMMDLISKLIDLGSPFVKLQQKPHKRGTCTVANTKGAILAASYLLALEERLNERGQTFDDIDSIDSAEMNEIKEECRQIAKKFYKQFTNFMRNHELDDLLRKVESETHNQAFYSGVLSEIVLEHPHFEKKHGQEGLRICKIWDALPPEYRVAVRQGMGGEKAENFEEKMDAFITENQENMPLLHQLQQTRAQEQQSSEKIPPSSTPSTPRTNSL